MSYIKIIVKGQNDKYPTRETVVMAEALPLFQSTFGNRLLNYIVCDKDGNALEKQGAPIKNSTIAPVSKNEILERMKERALQALHEKAEALKIKGHKRMKEETLMLAIQEATKAETQILNELQKENNTSQLQTSES